MPASALIINADDLGLAPAVDAGILAAWHAGAISDSTVLANIAELPRVLAAAREAGLPVGLHLNLTLGRPLCDPAEIPALVTADGTFMKRGMWPPMLPADQVQRELRAQLDRLLACGVSPSHLDSHHHIHRYPEILPLVMEMARELSVPVRATGVEMRAALRAARIRCPAAFTIAFYGAGATVETLIHETEACPGGVLEIMTHPGQPGAIPSSYAEERAEELRALTDPRWLGYLREREIPLVGFRELGE